MLRIYLATLCLISMLASYSAGAEPVQDRRITVRGGINRAPEAIRINLLAEPEVQEELKLDEEQKAKTTAVVEQLRGLVQSRSSPEERQKDPKDRVLQLQDKLDASVEVIAKLLNQQQSERLDQISLQVRGYEVLRDDEVVTELKLTDEQRQQLRQAYDEAVAKEQKIVVVGPDGLVAPDRGEKLAELKKELTEKSFAVLTDEQRAQLEKMQGKKIELPRGAGVNFRGGRRRR